MFVLSAGMGVTLSFLRRAEWLSDERARSVRRVLACLLPGLALLWIALSSGGTDPAGHPLGTDYLSFWTAARFAVEGAPGSAYDLAAHYAAQRAQAGIDPGYAAFFYPPPFLLALLPFGLLSYFPSLLLWLGTTFVLYWRAIRAWTVGWAGTTVTLIAYPAVLANAGGGQNGFLTAALLSWGAILLGRRPWLGGFLLGLLVIKPHLALVVPFALLFRRCWRGLAGAAGAAVAACLLSLLLLGPEVWLGFVQGSALARQTLEQGLVDPAKMQSLFAAFRLWGAPLPLAYAAQGLLFLAALAGLFSVARSGADGGAQAAAMVAAALIATPFLLDYDLTLAAFPLAWLFLQARKTGFLPWEKIALGAAFLLPLLSRSFATAAGVPIAPFILAALFALIVRRARSDHHHAAVDVDRLPGDVAPLAAR